MPFCPVYSMINDACGFNSIKLYLGLLALSHFHYVAVAEYLCDILYIIINYPSRLFLYQCFFWESKSISDTRTHIR